MLAQPGWREVDPFHDRHGPAQAPRDQLRDESALPVIADDLVPFSQQVGELRVGQQRSELPDSNNVCASHEFMWSWSRRLG